MKDYLLLKGSHLAMGCIRFYVYEYVHCIAPTAFLENGIQVEPPSSNRQEQPSRWDQRIFAISACSRLLL